jgi:hypothetical protein
LKPGDKPEAEFEIKAKKLKQGNIAIFMGYGNHKFIFQLPFPISSMFNASHHRFLIVTSVTPKHLQPRAMFF